MTDYSKIDFSKLKLPEWHANRTSVQFTMVRSPLGADMCASKLIVASLAANDSLCPWRLHGMEVPVIEYVQHVLENIRLVDAFIAAELKRIEGSENNKHTCVITIEVDGKLIRKYQAKEWEASEGPDGYWSLKAHGPQGLVKEEALPPRRDCTREEAMANPGCSEWNYCNGLWRPMPEVHSGPPGSFRYRTRAPKQVPKPPGVKAPKGMEWEEGSSWYLRDIGDKLNAGRKYGVPESRRWRDAMLACVAVFELEHPRFIPRFYDEQWSIGIDGTAMLGTRRFLLVEVSE